MDRIMPIDLERAELKKSFRGYSRQETDALLKGAADTLQTLLIENDRLKTELEHARAEITGMRLQQDILRDTLVIAQRAADETRQAAQRTADSLLDEARRSAQSERQSAQKQLQDIQWEIRQLESDKARFQGEFRHLLENHLSRLIETPSLTVLEGEATGA